MIAALRPLFIQNSIRLSLLLPVLALVPRLHAQFSSGSNGSYGPINIPDGESLTIPLPADGILHATTVNIGNSGQLFFIKNVANTPVYLLASGDININGYVYVNGSAGGSGTIPLGGAGGPGGFDGGTGQTAGQAAPGDGLGPGGGRGGEPIYYYNTTEENTKAGHAGFGARSDYTRPSNGDTYGSALLIPLVGGSGGGGTTDGYGGSGGGGAILMASTTRITLNGQIQAMAGNLTSNSEGVGSGGSVRLVSPRVEGVGYIDVGSSGNGYGRTRIDCIFKENLKLNLVPSGTGSIGGNIVVFPQNLPKLEIVEAAGQVVDPANNQPVTVQIPSGAPAQQTVKVRAVNFGGTAKVKVVLTPEFGSRASFDLDIPNPGPAAATGTATVTFPANQLTKIDVWTR